MVKKILLPIIILLLICECVFINAKEPVKQAPKTKTFEESISEAIYSGKEIAKIEEKVTPKKAKERMYLLINGNADFWYIYDGLNAITKNGYVDTVSIRKLYDSKTIEAGNKLVDTTTKSIAALVKDKKTDYDKVKFVYDYLVEKYGYDYGLVNLNVYELYEKKFATCTAFSVAFKDIMEELKIPCEITYSYPIRHEWNTVMIGGKWYNIDTSGGVIYTQQSKDFKYDCFLKSEKFFDAMGYTGKQMPEYVKCVDTTYDYKKIQ